MILIQLQVTHISLVIIVDRSKSMMTLLHSERNSYILLLLFDFLDETDATGIACTGSSSIAVGMYCTYILRSFI